MFLFSVLLSRCCLFCFQRYNWISTDAILYACFNSFFPFFLFFWCSSSVGAGNDRTTIQTEKKNWCLKNDRYAARATKNSEVKKRIRNANVFKRSTCSFPLLLISLFLLKEKKNIAAKSYVVLSVFVPFFHLLRSILYQIWVLFRCQMIYFSYF